MASGDRFKEFAESISNDVRKEMEKVIPDKKDNSFLNLSLYVPCNDLLSRGGKLIRPSFVYLFNRLTLNDYKQIAMFAAVPELMHNALLIADDVEDKSELRRGKPAIHKKYGEAIAVNAAGFMMVSPYKLIKNAPLNDNLKLRIYNAVFDELTNVHIGQALDNHWSTNNIYNVSEDEYLDMAALKTGSMFRMSAKIGLLLDNYEEQPLQEAMQFVDYFSLAFQIQDDILNLISDNFLGKEIGEDISEGKLTFPILYALKKSDKKDRLTEILSAKTRDKKRIKEAISIINDCKALDYSCTKSLEFLEKARKKLNSEFEDNDARRILNDLLDYLSERIDLKQKK